MPAIELPPLTAAHREAIRKCRWAGPLVGRGGAIAFTTDLELVRVLSPGAGMSPTERAKAGASEHAEVCTATSYTRSSDPPVIEWGLQFTHPDAVAFICDLMEERRA